MNTKQAIARLRKAIGPQLAWRENRHGVDAEERARQQAIATDLRKQERELRAALDALRLRLLDVPEYTELAKQIAFTKKKADEASMASRRYPLTVGRISKLADGLPGFFHVTVEGDNWEDVIARAKEKGILK